MPSKKKKLPKKVELTQNNNHKEPDRKNKITGKKGGGEAPSPFLCFFR